MVLRNTKKRGMVVVVGKWKKVGNFGEVWEGGGRRSLEKKKEGKRQEEKREAEIGDGYVLAGNMRT